MMFSDFGFRRSDWQICGGAKAQNQRRTSVEFRQRPLFASAMKKPPLEAAFFH
ncbi:hypothetical protein [Dyella flava]|uniref:hypothetical protein n=1 Tax=Dyella flava TaxID=1920170 RepID=UPI0036D2115F